MNNLEKYKLSFEEAVGLVDRAGREPDPIKIYYIEAHRNEIHHWFLDSRTYVENQNIINLYSWVDVPSIRSRSMYRFELSKRMWETPSEDAGFLNYLHAYGYLQVLKSKRAA